MPNMRSALTPKIIKKRGRFVCKFLMFEQSGNTREEAYLKMHDYLCDNYPQFAFAQFNTQFYNNVPESLLRRSRERVNLGRKLRKAETELSNAKADIKSRGYKTKEIRKTNRVSY